MTRLFILFVLSGCFESIASDTPETGEPDEPAPLAQFSTTRNADGSYTTIIDATSTTDWIYGDFETGAQSSMTAPWDLRFQRFHISTNGGISGAGGVEVVPVEGVPFAQVSAAPAAGWLHDSSDATTMKPVYAFAQGGGWYDYDPTTHVLTPRPLVWVVKTDDGGMIKLEITKYYDDAGTAGWLTLRWSHL